jgi:vacuolar-type H+-ATPase catalytic subunit A/Vma1
MSEITGDDYPTYEDSVNATLAERNTHDRFDLEEAMSNLYQIGEDIETIMYAIGDSPIKHSEDQILNMLIGMKQMHETRYQKMWNIFENLIANKTIKSNAN